MPPSDDLWTRLRQGVADRIDSLGLSSDLPTLPAPQVYSFAAPTLANEWAVCIQVTQEREKEEPAAGGTEYRAWWLPVRVWFLCRLELVRDAAVEAWFLSWRKQVIDLLHQRREPQGVPESQIALVTGDVIYDAAALPAYQLAVGSLRVRFLCREGRPD